MIPIQYTTMPKAQWPSAEKLAMDGVFLLMTSAAFFVYVC